MLKENISTHSETILQKTQNKKQLGFNMEERTPLRKFVVYGKDQQNSGNGQKALHNAAEQFSIKLQNDPKNFARNHLALLTN